MSVGRQDLGNTLTGHKIRQQRTLFALPLVYWRFTLMNKKGFTSISYLSFQMAGLRYVGFGGC
jgi:hypothetical protein